MANPETIDIIQKLNQNFERLIEMYESIRTRHDILALELEAAKSELNQKSEQVLQLDEKVKQLLITQAMTADSPTNEEAKAQLSRIIREIDRCLTLIEQ